MKYDVFVSYRRSSFESANLIAEKLRSMGYSVFFDVESLRSGNFNEQLFNVIDNCSDFVLVLPPNALDRCVNEDDWVRKEVIRAMQCKKNIIPVMLSGFTWPEQMPEQMQGLVYYQAITAGETEFFDMSMKRLATYLKCKPHKDLRKFYKKVLVGLAAVLVLLGIAGGVVYHMSISVCRDVADSISGGMHIVNEIQRGELRMYEAWQEFLRERTLEIYRDDPQVEARFVRRIKGIEDSLKPMIESIDKPFEFTAVEKFLLGLYDITPQDVNLLYAVFDSHIRNMAESVNMYSAYSKSKPTKYIEDGATFRFQLIKSECNQLYYIYMLLLSVCPDSAIETHHRLVSKFDMFPNDVRLDLSREEYEALIKVEENAYANLMQKFQASIAEMKGKVMAQEEQLEKSAAANK